MVVFVPLLNQLMGSLGCEHLLKENHDAWVLRVSGVPSGSEGCFDPEE